MAGKPAVEVHAQASATSRAAPGDLYDVLADLRSHLVWAGERAPDPTFRLLTLDAPGGVATVGTEFSSTGANFNGTFHDRSRVTEATRPDAFVIETESRLERKRGAEWEARFVHRYTVGAHGAGSRVTCGETIRPVNYVPYWLRPGTRAILRWFLERAVRKHLENLARLAEERSAAA